jgi:hypothetical protein
VLLGINKFAEGALPANITLGADVVKGVVPLLLVDSLGPTLDMSLGSISTIGASLPVNFTLGADDIGDALALLL